MKKYQTSDGEIFKEIGDARLHAKSLTDSTVAEVGDKVEVEAEVETEVEVEVETEVEVEAEGEVKPEAEVETEVEAPKGKRKIVNRTS
jgi:hypothetical protein